MNRELKTEWFLYVNRRFLRVLRLLFPVYCFALPWAFSVEYPSPTGYVTDAAGLLDPASRQQLEQQLSEFEKRTTYEIAVVTIPSLEGETIESYAVELFRRWGIGKKWKDNGVLLLIAAQDRKIRIEVGYGLEALIPDAAAGSIIRSDLTPAFRQSRYAEGIHAAADSLMARLGSPARPRADDPYPRVSWWDEPFFREHFLMFVLVMVVLPLFFGFFVWYDRRSGYDSHTSYWDLFDDSGGGSGGFGGFGGGFGGFGGGGSGGGGASGGW